MLRLFAFLRNVHALDLLQVRAHRRLHFGQGHFAQWLVLGLFDTEQRRIAQLVDAGLDRKHRGERNLHELKVTGFEFALYFDPSFGLFDLHDDGRMRPAQQLSENYASLSKAVVIRLQTSENEVERFVFDRCSECSRGIESIESHKTWIFQMNRTVRSLRERLAQDLLGSSRTCGDYASLAPLFLLLTQPPFNPSCLHLVHSI